MVGALYGAWRVAESFRAWVHCFVMWGVALFWLPVYYHRTYRCTPVLLCSSTGLLPYVLLHCCTAVVGWSVGGGWVMDRWWVHWVVPGGLLVDPFVRGLIFSCCGIGPIFGTGLLPYVLLHSSVHYY